jgi:hypothetical protein
MGKRPITKERKGRIAVQCAERMLAQLVGVIFVINFSLDSPSAPYFKCLFICLFSFSFISFPYPPHDCIAISCNFMLERFMQAHRVNSQLYAVKEEIQLVLIIRGKR